MASSKEAITLKSGDLFFLCEPAGDVPLERGHGLGLFYHDCRFLNGYTLRIAGQKPELHATSLENGNTAMLQLLIPELWLDDQTLPSAAVEIDWSRRVSGEELALIEVITLRSLTSERIILPVTLHFQCQFEDLFALRGMTQTTRGRLHPPVWKNENLHFLYEGADHIDRELSVNFWVCPQGAADSQPPFVPQDGRPGDRPSLRGSPHARSPSEASTARFLIELAPNEYQQLRISLFVSESSQRTTKRWRSDTPSASPPKTNTQVHSDNESFNRLMHRSLGDLEMLRCGSGDESYFAAGVPWYVALFGRDSIITALEMLAYNTAIAEATIRLLARHQGREINAWRDEEPGKILHELRVGEMANLHEIPHTPYYGSIDATPLWLILIGRHAAWTGDLRVFNELRPNIEAALNWIEHYGDFDRDGYIEYQCKSEGGLINQGWKDSGDGIVNADGSLGIPPIALVEVQGYVYAAQIEMAALYRHAGDDERANILEGEAQQLRARFNRDFWLADGYYALALEGVGDKKSAAAVLSSNAGHALWAGIAETEHARQTAGHLLSSEMFSGWGIRTLSAAAKRYDPLAYHLGTIWPHDNSLIAAGCKRYGFDEDALRIFNAMIESAEQFENNRLPELFGGFPRQPNESPVPYPIACQPQAWAAGTIPYLLTVMLGLEPEAFDGRLRIIRPTLPRNIDRMEVRQLRVGTAQVDLLFERRNGVVATNVQKLEDDMEVVVES